MRILPFLAIPFLICHAALAPAFAQGAAPPLAHDMTHGMAMAPADPPAATAADALMQTMTDMQHDMSAAPMTGDPDGDFVRMMLAHHRGAVAMARVQIRHGRDPAMKALARRIVTDQEREIAQMNAWLKAHPGR